MELTMHAAVLADLEAAPKPNHNAPERRRLHVFRTHERCPAGKYAVVPLGRHWAKGCLLNRQVLYGLCHH